MENTLPGIGGSDIQFHALQEIVNLIAISDCKTAHTNREQYLIGVIARINSIAADGICPDYKRLVVPLIDSLRALKLQQPSGKMPCPKCGGDLLYSVGVLGSVVIKCKTAGCLAWTEIKSE